MLRRLSQINRILSGKQVRSLMSQSYQVASVSDLQDGEKKEVELENGAKILLAKLNGKFLATSANCTHYGAPLKNGVLTPEGRITCPWHGVR